MNAPHHTLQHFLAERASYPGPALVDRGRPVGFHELTQEGRRVAHGLERLGVGPGDRVALWLPNLPAWLASFFACAQLGAIAVSVNTRFRSQEVADIVARSGARVLVLWPRFQGIDFASILAQCDPAALERLESIVVYSEDGTPAPQAVVGKPAVGYEALASGAALLQGAAASSAGCVIFTTSGTTSAPKFVLHDQRRVIAHALSVARAFGLDAGSSMLLAPPLCGVYGFCSAMAALAAGRPLVMRPAWDAAQAAQDILAHRVTHANATDEAVAQLLAQSPAQEPFPGVRFFGYAAFSPAHADIAQRAQARGLRLVGLYGISEIQALFARQDENAPLEQRATAGGKPVSAAARVRARDPGSGRILAHGEAGELEFDAPESRMVGYFGDPDATARALSEDGYYRSGDLGRTHPDGRFTFLARMGDALRLGGFLVSPPEIEAVVQAFPGISACQVVGVPRAEGLRPVAFVVLEPGAALNEPALLAHVARNLAAYKVPLRAFGLESFPVTPGANATKIQKSKLRELAESLLRA
ncbi:MAG TPA: AMP-binding protein [Burkholderiales bacterium]|nr:AMP-binding protein [Burkholderiales bacterium]